MAVSILPKDINTGETNADINIKTLSATVEMKYKQNMTDSTAFASIKKTTSQECRVCW
jgi:hypothetical protein